MLNNIWKIIFLVFLLSCADDKTTNSNDNNSSENITIFGSSDNLNIITWNIEHFPKEDELTIQYLSEAILLMNVDIIALQEIESSVAFNDLIAELGDNWIGYRSENSDWGELAYLININKIDFEDSPYSILTNNEYYFAFRPPYVFEFTYNNMPFVLINIHYKCCGDGVLEEEYSDEEYRRFMASNYLDEYVTNNFANQNVIIIGDFNDELIDDNNVFEVFLNNSEEYYFADYAMAEQFNQWEYWSYPSWPSHLDHIYQKLQILVFFEELLQKFLPILLNHFYQ